jgi:hypothetical protein
MTRVAVMLVACLVATVTASTVAQSGSLISVFVSFEKDGRTGAELSDSGDLLAASLDGKPLEILHVSRVNAGASVLLLVDLTWTTTRGHHPGHDPNVDHLKRGLASMGMGWIPFPGLLLGLDKAFLPLLGPDDDLRVGSFGGQRLTFSRAASAEPAARLAAFNEVITPDVVPLADWFGASRVWDAVAAASKQLSNDSHFRSIVLVTDGQSSGNHIGHAEAITAAVSHRVAVHVVGRNSLFGPSLAPAPETFVGRLAEQTGGLLRIDEAPLERQRIPWDKPVPVFRDIVNAIHNTYEIRLNVGAVAEGAHRLEFRTAVPRMRVHAPAWLITGGSRQAHLSKEVLLATSGPAPRRHGR